MKRIKRYFLFVLITISASNSLSAQTHRIRIQIQGDDIKSDISGKWEKDYIITKQDGLDMLDELWNKLNSSQQDERKDGYYQARDFIKNSPSKGRTDQGSRSFKNSNRRVDNSRVDIEINRGAAFSDDRHIIYLRIIGPDLSSNRSWQYDKKYILTKKEALSELYNLWNQLSGDQKAIRESAYKDAVDYISGAGINGIEGSNLIKEFTDSKAKNGERIVITIDKGAAFSD
jgi:hypothetical protein